MPRVTRKRFWVVLAMGAIFLKAVGGMIFPILNSRPDEGLRDVLRLSIAQTSHWFITPFTSIPESAAVGPVEDIPETLESPRLIPNIEVIEFKDTPQRQQKFVFRYERFDQPKLIKLREKYSLNKQIAKGNSQFEQMILLSDWVSRQWKHGRSGYRGDTRYQFNALEILSRVAQGQQFFCSEYAVTFIQSALALGWTARAVGLLKGHYVTEIWSDDFNKWFVLDPDYNLHYEKDGIPLNARELAEVAALHNTEDVKLVLGPSGAVTDAPPHSKEDMISYYQHFRVRFRNDWYGTQLPKFHPLGNSIMNSVELIGIGHNYNSLLVSRDTQDYADLYWPLNKVDIDVEYVNGSLRLFFSTTTPNFVAFLLRNDPDEPFKTHQGHYITHNLKNKPLWLEVRTKNAFGYRGSISRISVKNLNR